MWYKLKRILIYPDGVTEKQVYPTWWKPDASRTICYFEFENNLNDSSWNNNNATASNNIWYDTVWWQTVAKITGTQWYIKLPNLWNWIWTGDFTISFWIYPVSSWRDVWMFLINNSNLSPNMFMLSNSNFYIRPPVWWQQPWALTVNTWQYVTFTRISWVCKFYKNATQLGSSWNDTTSISAGATWLFSRYESGANQYFNAWAMMDKFIFENVWWSDAETTDYYNQTKSTYGL